MELWLWEDKYPAFKVLGKWEKKEYWKQVHEAHGDVRAHLRLIQRCLARCGLGPWAV